MLLLCGLTDHPIHRIVTKIRSLYNPNKLFNRIYHVGIPIYIFIYTIYNILYSIVQPEHIRMTEAQFRDNKFDDDDDGNRTQV